MHLKTDTMSKKSSYGLGVPGVLLIVFIVLKLIKVITWSWWLVLSPLWIVAAVWIAIIMFVAIFGWLYNRKN